MKHNPPILYPFHHVVPGCSGLYLVVPGCTWLCLFVSFFSIFTDLRELSPPHEGAREQPKTVDHEDAEEEPEEPTEQLEVGPAVPHKAFSMEDEERPTGEDDDEKDD